MKFFTKLFDIRSGEKTLVLLLFLYSLFVGLVESSLFVSTNAIFLSEFGVELLPYVYLSVAFIVTITGSSYSLFQRTISSKKLFPLTLLFLLAMVAAFWTALTFAKSPALIFSWMVLYGLVAMLCRISFWAVVNETFDIRQSQRLIGSIATGELLGRIAINLCIPLYVSVFGTVNILLLSMGAVAAQLLLLFYVEKEKPPSSTDNRAISKKKLSIGSLFDRFVSTLFFIYLIATSSNILMNFSFFDGANMQFTNEKELASFFALFFASAQGVTALLRITAVAPFFQRYGITTAITLLPIMYLLGFSSLAVTSWVADKKLWIPFFIVALKFSEEVLRNGYFELSFRIFLQPLPPKKRLQTQVFVETVSFPLGIGLGGAFLLLLKIFSYLNLIAVAYLLTLLAILWLALTFTVCSDYRKKLLEAISERRLGEKTSLILDQDTMQSLEKKIMSKYPDESIYILQLIKRGSLTAFKSAIRRAINHPASSVRYFVLKSIEELHIKEAVEPLTRLLLHREPKTRGLAMKSLLAIHAKEANRLAFRFLNDPREEVSKEVAAGLLKYGNDKGKKRVKEYLMELVDSKNIDKQLLAATIYAEAGTDEDVEIINTLLMNKSPDVVRRSLSAAGRIHSLSLLKKIVDALENPLFSHTALNVLVESKNQHILPIILRKLQQKKGDSSLITLLFKIGTSIAGKDFAPHIVEWVNDNDTEIRLAAHLALSGIKYHAKDDNEKALFYTVLYREINFVREIDNKTFPQKKDNNSELFHNAIEHVELDAIKRIFLILSLIYDHEIIHGIMKAYLSGVKTQRAYALELLKNTISKKISNDFLSILEHPFLESKKPSHEQLHLHFIKEVIVNEEEKYDVWSQACAIYCGANEAPRMLINEFERAQSSTSRLVRETATWAIERNIDKKGNRMSLSTVEKVIILKTVKIFAETDENILAEIAANLDELRIDSGVKIFEKGDLGDHFYIILNGEVRIHDGEKVIALLQERSSFGEMALLDYEVRSASATSTKESALLTLNKELFDELIERHSAIARGIIRALATMVRQMIQNN